MVHENLFHRLGDAMAGDGAGAVAGHQADDERADDGDENDPGVWMGEGIIDGGDAELAAEGEVGDELDQKDQQLRGECADEADDDREEGDVDGAGVDEVGAVGDVGGDRCRGPSEGAMGIPPVVEACSMSPSPDDCAGGTSELIPSFNGVKPGRRRIIWESIRFASDRWRSL